MPRLPVVSGREVIRALEKAGFTTLGQEGSHVKLRKSRGERAYTVIVPAHPELARKTLTSILRQAGMSAEEFRRCL